MLGEHFTSGFVDVERIGNNSFSGSTQTFSGDAKTIISVSNSDRAWRRGQLGEDHPRKQAEGAEGEQEVPRCPKVTIF